MDTPALRRLLLALASPVRPADPALLARLDAADWSALDAMAAQHRLQPTLHTLHRADGFCF